MKAKLSELGLHGGRELSKFLRFAGFENLSLGGDSAYISEVRAGEIGEVTKERKLKISILLFFSYSTTNSGLSLLKNNPQLPLR